MIEEPKCSIRKCAHFLGAKNDGDETTERVYCEAFKNKIPDEIAYGKNKHEKPYPNQGNDIVFEPIKE